MTEAENKIMLESLGWMYAEACLLADAGKDIRLIEVSGLIERAQIELKEQEPE